MNDYTLHYWPIPFRGHFIRYALAAAGASWQEAVTAPGEIDYPFRAQPLLVDHADGRRLSQAPAIAMYLGRKHGLIVEPDETLRLICDAMDVLYEITRAHGAQMWDRPAWADFVGARLTGWMAIHERFCRLQGLSAVAGHVFGTPVPSLADLTLTALWHTMVDKLPELRPVLHQAAPHLEALVDRVAEVPEIARVRADWPGAAYCGGQIEASIRAMLAAGGGREA
ncbi:MAG: hypothetical protein KDK53_04995 [Maritimibacter sp.]|nr:hypothetical protein [Maritimibacter sp.]